MSLMMPSWVSQEIDVPFFVQEQLLEQFGRSRCRRPLGQLAKDVGQVVSAGVQSIELAVQHVRKPGQGMPVVGMAGGEGPADSFGSQAAA